MSIGSATLPPVSNPIFSLPLALSTLPCVWFSGDIPGAISNPLIALSGMAQNDGCPLVCVWLGSSGRDSAALPRSSRVTSLRDFNHCRAAAGLTASLTGNDNSHLALCKHLIYLPRQESQLLVPWEVFTRGKLVSYVCMHSCASDRGWPIIYFQFWIFVTRIKGLVVVWQLIDMSALTKKKNKKTRIIL